MASYGGRGSEVNGIGGGAGGGEEEKGGCGKGGQEWFHRAFLSCPDAHAIRHSEICTTES